MNPDKTGKFIHKLRQNKKLSQYQLADMIPISRQAVSKWERGESVPDSSTLLRLSDIFDVTINELLNGERFKENTIEQLEQTTLSILDESNQKTRRIKRNFKISVTIITALLLAFLSYYFINSYNSTKVYVVGNDKGTFKTYNGILITTKERTYLKLGKLKYNDDIEINNIKLYYKDSNNKNKLIAEDSDIDNISIMDINGYSEKISEADRKRVMNSSYLEITYNDTEKEIIKLKFERIFRNNNLIYTKKIQNASKYKKKNDPITSVVVGREIPKKEDKKEETKEEPKEIIKEKVIITEMPVQEAIKKQANIESATDKLKNAGMDLGGTYYYEVPGKNIAFLYFESQNQLKMMEDDIDSWDYIITEKAYTCINYKGDECVNYIEKSIIDYLN